jgi:uncharacterized protein YndB with AHSA1/START domain
MRYLKWFVVMSAGMWAAVAVAFTIAVIVIPAEKSFTNEVDIAATPEQVWQVIFDKKRYPEWQTAITNVEVTDEKNWIEYTKNAPDPMHFTVVNDKRPAEVELHYTMGDAFGGHWHGTITPTATGVKLKTVDSYKADGWLSKVMVGVLFDLDKFAKDWNTKLKARVESIGK